MDTNGVDIVKTTSGMDTPQHEQRYHKGQFLSEKAKVSEIDGIRGLLVHEKPGVVAGKPNSTAFPFESITLNLKSPLGPKSAEKNGPKSLPSSITIDGPDLDAALQYGPTPGLSFFRTWLEEFQTVVHNRPKKQGEVEWTVTLGGGSQDMMYKTFGALLNPGDPVLIETPVYAGVLPPLRALNSKMVEVDVDEQGLSAERLEEILQSWPADQKRPKVIYVNPTGCNPSGCSHSEERKLQVLGVCQKYGLIIMEDDPYYFLAQQRSPSYFELETEVFPSGGHVVRFDSCSKLLSAGLRLGFATGPKDILHAVDVTTAGACLHTSGVSQIVAYGLMKHWGIDGFLAHAQDVADFYAARRERFEAIAHKYLDGLATWVSPTAGMFLWIDLASAGVKDSFKLIRQEALAKGVLAVPGFAFYPNGRTSSHVRTSFSLVDLDEDADVGMERLAGAIKDWQRENGQ